MVATYTIVLMRERDGRYSVSVPALKGCHTWGETLPEALEMANEAITAYLEVLVEDGEPIPPDEERETGIRDQGSGISCLGLAPNP